MAAASATSVSLAVHVEVLSVVNPDTSTEFAVLTVIDGVTCVANAVADASNCKVAVASSGVVVSTPV